MFVSSSLERIPQPAPIVKSRSFTQVNINGSTGGDNNGRQQLLSHPAVSSSSSATSITPSSASTSSEDKTPPPCSPTLPTTKANAADEVINIPVPTTRICSQVKPLAETHIENDKDVNTTEQQLVKEENKIEDKTEEREIEKGEEFKNNGKNEEAEEVDEEEEEEIRAQVTTKTTTTSTATTSPTLTTSSSTYSRYDIYRWRERPFGPSYRRKERQRREHELMEEKNNNNIFHNNNGVNKICAEKNDEDDKFHPFMNRFTSPLTYYEEEYSYEPEKQISSMKTVLRTRSMVNLDGDDGKVLVRKTLSDANLDQDKTTNFRFNHDRNASHTAANNNIPTEKHHYFGYLDLQNHYHEKQDHHETYKQHYQQKKQQNNENNQEYNTIEEGTFRQRLRDLLVNNELVIQPRRNQPLDTPTNRRCFYHPVRINRELIDEELPDPDQVKLARDRFEKVLKIKGPEAPKGLQRTASVPPGQRITPEVRVPLSHSNTLPAKITPSLEKWTDTGSLSSGISSASEDVEDQLHEVSSEVLQKIRACGTTVTYYGGKVIAQSRGPPSPLTSTIMEEIKFRLEVRDRLAFEEYTPSEEH